MVGEPLIEAVKLTTFVRGEVAIAGKGLQKTGGERSIDTLEQLQEEHANGIAFVQETVTTRVRQFGHQAFGAQLRKIVAQRGQRVLGLGKSESVQHRRVEIGGGEGGAGGDVGIADQSMHHRQLPRVIELKARDALSVGQGGGLSQFLELAAIDESFQDVLLGIVVVVNDLGHALAQLRQILDVLFDTIVGDVIGGRLGS